MQALKMLYALKEYFRARIAEHANVEAANAGRDFENPVVLEQELRDAEAVLRLSLEELRGTEDRDCRELRIAGIILQEEERGKRVYVVEDCDGHPLGGYTDADQALSLARRWPGFSVVTAYIGEVEMAYASYKDGVCLRWGY